MWFSHRSFLFLNYRPGHINYQGEKMDKNIKSILDRLPDKVENFYLNNPDKNITEIRIRVNFDIKICIDGRYISVEDTALTQKEINKLFLSFCDNTLSAYEDQIAQGFITLAGGHRVGIAGKFTNDIYGKTVISSIQSLNIRLANYHSWRIDDEILHFTQGLLISGPPHSGKTTFVRSLCRYLQGQNIAVCDERNEIYSQDINADFIVNLPKAVAIAQATRTLNPDIIICDEIGSEKETKEILSSVNSGVKFVCTVHSSSIDSLHSKPNMALLLAANIFDKIVLLGNEDNNFYIKEIRDV